MPTTIPYDPSLVLGNIVPLEKLKVVEDIAALQSKIDAAEDALNLNIELKRNLDLTKQEMLDMGISDTDIVDVQKSIEEVKKEIAESAKNYAKTRLETQKEILEKKTQMRMVNSSIESPIDYNRTMIKADMPLSADSLKMNVQYYSFDENKQSAENYASNIASFVSEQVDYFSFEQKTQVSNNVKKQVTSQVERHDIAGTLIISAVCTHKNALLLAPFILDVDKSIRAWNKLYPSKLIKVGDIESMMTISKEEGTNEEERMMILSGATSGSSFVGMVHILNSSTTETSQTMKTLVEDIQEKASYGWWFVKATGQVALDDQVSSDLKKMLSRQTVNSHVTLITTGIIPSIASNALQTGVKEFAEFDGKSMMDKLVSMQTWANGERIGAEGDESAESAKDSSKMLSFRNNEVKSMMTGLAEIKWKENQVLDTNSLMNAFTDYVTKVGTPGMIGVPINYYLKPISRAQLAQMWVAKYYPGKFLEISGDDSKSQGTNTGA